MEARLFSAQTGDEAYALLERGVDPNARDASGATALHHAARAGRLDVVSALVGWVPVDRSARDGDGRTPLDVATDPAVRAVLAAVSTPRSLRSEHGEAAWRSDVAQLESLVHAPFAETRRLARGIAIRSGPADNTRNGVVCSDATDAEIAATLAWLGDVPATWLIDAGSTLGPALERAGCRPERTAVFMALPNPSWSPSGRHVDVQATSAGRSWRHFWVGDNAHATTFTVNCVCTLVDLWVAPDARRRGLGTVVTQAAVAASGATLALLAPTPATVPFYERLGFLVEAYLSDRVYYTG